MPTHPPPPDAPGPRARRLAAACEVDASVLARPSLLGGDADDPEPLWASRARGPYVWDEQGRRYLDFMLGYGSVILGHADPEVTEAVVEEIRAGVSPTLRRRTQFDLAELLVQLVPNADMVLLMKTGSEATSAAVRLARAYTGRDVVLRWGYHGWHDWCAPRPTGIPAGYRSLTVELPFNDPAGVAEVARRYRDRVAALVVQPGDAVPATAEYLHECRRVADEVGAVLVLDEIRTGFRLALGGAQEYFGVRADLVTVSKAMANGHPISALVGRRAIMRRLPEVSHSSLYSRSTDGIAAALATLRLLAGTDALARIWSLGERLMDGMRDAVSRSGLPVRVIGLPPAPFHEFDLPEPARRYAMDAFYQEVWDNGLLLHRGHHWFVCRDMTVEDIDTALAVMAKGYRAAADRLG